LAEGAPRRDRSLAIGLAALVAVVLVLGGLAVWFVLRPASDMAGPTAGAGDFEQYREAYESAVAKAGVEATFPPEPVALDKLEAEGSHPFEALFTAEEATALLAMHPLIATVEGSQVSLIEPELLFAEGAAMTIGGRILADGRRFRAQIEGPVGFDPDSGVTSPGATEAKVEGFSANESQRSQATDLVLDYGNEYLDAAPGLSVESVTIDSDGVTVAGQAPDRLLTP
jgi:hypothetical protein